jgi:hypothetical protein
MPYINKKDRELIDEFGDFTGQPGLDAFFNKLDRLRESSAQIGNTQTLLAYHPGTLNYIITRLCDYWTKDIDGESNYERYNAVIGVLECAKQELYRRQIAPYEDKKCEENGDVYQDGT